MKCSKCKNDTVIQNDIVYVNHHPIGVIKTAYCKCGHKEKVLQ